MDAPYYSVTVTNFTRGWSYAMTHGQVPDPDVDVHLADPLTYTWGYEGGLVPGQMLPCSARVTLWSRTAGTAPECRIGDDVAFAVRIGAAGPFIAAPSPMRVAAADIEITDDPDFAARLSIDLVDTLIDLGSLVPHVLGNGGIVGAARLRWRARLAEVAATIGVTIACPAWWNDLEQPPLAGPGTYGSGLDTPSTNTGGWNGKSARDVITTLLNAHQPNGYTHTAIAQIGSMPAGYRRVGPDTYWGDRNDNADAGVCYIAEPDTSQRIILMPASRKINGHRPANIDADWCLLPTKARLSREHGFNTIRLLGEEYGKDQPGDPYYKTREGERTHISPASRDQVGPIQRDLPVALNLGYYDQPDAPAGQPAASRFITDGTDLGAGYVFEAFQIVSSDIPQADALALLPYLAPRFPGEPDGDGYVLRHITIHNIKASAQLTGPTVSGFNNAGQLTISGGEMTWSLSMTPGQPQP